MKALGLTYFLAGMVLGTSKPSRHRTCVSKEIEAILMLKIRVSSHANTQGSTIVVLEVDAHKHLTPLAAKYYIYPLPARWSFLKHGVALVRLVEAERIVWVGVCDMQTTKQSDKFLKA